MNKSLKITVLSQKRKLIFSLKKRNVLGTSSPQSLLNTVWVYFYTLVSEVTQPVGAMLIWRLTVKANNILFIQRDKLTVDRATTHGMLGVWNREFIYENKEIQEERNPVKVCTEKNAQGSCWHQTLHFIWRSATSNPLFRGSGLKHKL